MPAASSSRRLLRAGVGLWILALAVVAVLVALDPVRRSVTPVFHLAAERWWARRPLYSDPRGFHYLPQFALLFSPFHALPAPAGDLLWRAASVAAVVLGAIGLGRRIRSADTDRVLGLALVLAIWPCLGAIRNGQTNLAFAGLVTILAALLSAQRWVGAAVVLALLVAVKPLGLVFVLLAPWVFPRLVRPLAAALGALAALPFLFAPPAYVASQYRDAAVHLAGWSGTTEARFADLAALLRRLGLALGSGTAAALRLGAALATLGLWIVARRRAEPWRALTLALLGSLYLLLFNPMTEKNTYAIVAPALGIAAGWAFSTPRGRGFGRVAAAALLSTGVFPEAFRRLDPNFGLWWDPLAATAVAAALCVGVLRHEDAAPGVGRLTAEE